MAASESSDRPPDEKAVRAEYEYDDRYVPVWAVDTLPLWGRVLAWFVWHAPSVWYRNVGVVALAVALWKGWRSLYALVVLTTVFYALSFYARRTHPSPFGAAVLVEREKVNLADGDSDGEA